MAHSCDTPVAPHASEFLTQSCGLSRNDRPPPAHSSHRHDTHAEPGCTIPQNTSPRPSARLPQASEWRSFTPRQSDYSTVSVVQYCSGIHTSPMSLAGSGVLTTIISLMLDAISFVPLRTSTITWVSGRFSVNLKPPVVSLRRRFIIPTSVCTDLRPTGRPPKCQSRSKKGQCPGAKLDTWFDLGAHPGACAFQIADACQGALAAGQPFRSFGIFRITVWRFCSGATGSFRRSSRGYGRGGSGDREWRL